MKIIDKFRIQTYNIGFVKKSIGKVLDEGLLKNDVKWLKHKYKDRFFADPFMIKEDNDNYYILAEEFIFWEEKGKISLLKVDKKDFSLQMKKTVIEEETHLSFPYCTINGKVVTPESVKSGKTKGYLLNTDEFYVESDICILNEGIVDGVFYNDGHSEWLLANNEMNPKEDLYLYKREGIRWAKKNDGKPILKGIRVARGAGLIFKYNGKIYRPVQDCEGRYGRQTIIYELCEIRDDYIKCVEKIVLNSFENAPYDETLHTFNVYDNVIMVDGSKDFMRFPVKILYKKFRWMFK